MKKVLNIVTVFSSICLIGCSQTALENIGQPRICDTYEASIVNTLKGMNRLENRMDNLGNESNSLADSLDDLGSAFEGIGEVFGYANTLMETKAQILETCGSSRWNNIVTKYDYLLNLDGENGSKKADHNLYTNEAMEKESSSEATVENSEFLETCFASSSTDSESDSYSCNIENPATGDIRVSWGDGVNTKYIIYDDGSAIIEVQDKIWNGTHELVTHEGKDYRMITSSEGSTVWLP